MNSSNAPPPFRADTSGARQRIFERIRTAQGREASAPAVADARSRMASPSRGPQPAALAAPVATFIERALTLSCTVDWLSDAQRIPEAIAAYLQAHSLPRQLVAWPALAGQPWLDVLQADIGVRVRLGAPAGDDLVGLSAVAAAVAETGTLMLRSSPATPASTHLLPETHIAVVHASDIVETLEDGFERVRSGGEPLPRALNLVSGPSRTGDIEQTIVLGAHGPYRVHLLIVGGV